MHFSAQVSALGLFTLAGSASAQSTLYQHDAFAPGLGYGFNVCNIGDIDLDGVNDYIVAAYKGGGYADLYSGRTGELIEQLHESGCYGMGLAALGDIDGDSVPDFAVGSPREDSLLEPRAGRVRIYSGVDRSVLYVLEGDQMGARFGLSLGNAGDVTGDGIDDLIVGSWWEDFDLIEQGSADVYSGVDGTHVFQVKGTTLYQWFGTAVCSAGDIDSDGFADILVGAPTRWYSNYQNTPGSAQVFSGADGSLMRTYTGFNANDFYGTSVELLPDLTGDGIPEHAIGSPRHKVFGQELGAVFVYGGAQGLLITTLTGTDVGGRFGTRVAAGDDLDADGVPELLISACACVNVGPTSGINGAVEVRNPLDGALLERIVGPPLVGYGYSIASLGDLNGDGIGEFVYGNHWDDDVGVQAGSGSVASMADLALESSAHLLSIADGGAAELSIDVGAGHAGSTYWVVGSFSGTEPGLLLGGVHVPLNFDAFTSLSLGSPNSAVLDNTLGFLDASGGASAAIQIGPAALGASAAGLTSFFVVTVLDASGLVFASNPVPISFTD